MNNQITLVHKPKKLSKKGRSLKLGTYSHYHHGDLYEVIGVAIHSHGNPEEEFVVYRELFKPGRLLVRRLSIFTSPAELNGHRVVRFMKVKNVTKKAKVI
ncbi:MAG: DUF1653 domain-containing protein [bacterium]|nr:DUF1653 domain-containing protein [bacterium]